MKLVRAVVLHLQLASPSMNKKTTIIIVDDHQLVAQGIAGFFQDDEDVEVIGIFESPAEALTRIKLHPPDLVFTDLDMPGMNGLELAQQIQNENLACKIVLLTMHLNQSVVKKVMRQNLNGYLPKNADKTEVKACLEALKTGANYYSAKAMHVLMTESQEIAVTGLKRTQVLTDREREILVLIAEGMSTREVADRLFIAVRTVETHRKAILEKLEVKNVAGMVRIAVQEGLLDS